VQGDHQCSYREEERKGQMTYSSGQSKSAYHIACEPPIFSQIGGQIQIQFVKRSSKMYLRSFSHERLFFSIFSAG
jgi:hypothetical protein